MTIINLTWGKVFVYALLMGVGSGVARSVADAFDNDTVGCVISGEPAGPIVITCNEEP